jgi:ABC-2 type transport system permease protein
MEFKTLKLLDKIRPVFEKMGINYPVMREILALKLLMDGRRVPTVISGNTKRKSDKDEGNKFIKSLWIYILFGLILIPFIMLKSNYIFQMSLVFGIVMFLVTTSLISDFSSVLLDIRDRNIIGTKPVDRKTLSMAKTIHILIYMFFITAALTGPALITSFFIQGPIFFLLFLLMLILIDMFCIILTTLIYFLVLKYFDGEKLKDIINYIQIILSIAVTIGYQLIGRMFNIVDLKIEFTPSWWQYIIPPIWFSGPFQILLKSDYNLYYVVFSLLAIILPVITLLIYLKLTPQFEKNLQKLSNNAESRKRGGRKSAILLSKLLCQSSEEKIFFQFAMNMMSKERSFKLKVYPSLGFSIVFPFIFLFQLLNDSGLKDNITKGRTYLFIYFCGFMLPTLVMMMRYSESYKAAWIYKALPIGELNSAFKGTIKALITRLFLPIYIIEAFIFAAIYGVRIVPDLMAVFINMLIFIVLCFMLMDKCLPFTKNFEAVQQNNGGTVFLLLLILAVLAGVHYISTYFKFGVFIFLCLVLIVNIILWGVAFRDSVKIGNKDC